MCKKYLWEKLRGIKRITAMFLAAVLSVSVVSFMLPRNLVKAQAAGTGKNLQIGSSVLTPVMASVEDETYFPSNTKGRVTTAQTVYYGSNRNQKWLAIGYDGDGAVKVSGTVTLFAADDIEINTQYQAEGTSNSYENSDIRKILIGESNENGEGGHYNSRFTSVEKGAIIARSLTAGAYSYDVDSFCDGISGSSLLADKLWLLSTKEADLLKQDYRAGSHSWWLRSPGLHVNCVASVNCYDGSVQFNGDEVNYSFRVRPAFNLKLQPIILTSAATGGKSSGNLGAGALREVAAYSGNEWKLTLLDDGSINAVGNRHADFNATRTDSGTVTAGNAITIDYSNAKTGANEYVSAILVSASDVNTPLYYGRIAHNSDSGTDVNINIPVNLATGNYQIKVFAEQYNGDKMTDLVSSFVSIPVAVMAAPPTPQGGDVDYFADLKNAFYYAIALGGNQTVTWNTDCVLTYEIMQLLAENPSITLAFSYTYEDMDYTVTIPGRLAKFDPEIPIYGPLYLYGMYGGTVKKHQ